MQKGSTSTMFMFSAFKNVVIFSVLLCLWSIALANLSALPSIPNWLGFAGAYLPSFLSQPKSPVSFNHGFPHVSSWSSWFHPENSITWKPHAQKKGNHLYHLGRTGPWIEMIDGVLPREYGIGPPESCTVDQVHMMSRHAGRYPTKNSGKRQIALLDRIRKTGIPLNGSLAFLNDWSYITDTPLLDFEQLTSSGPYAGTLEAFATGTRLQTRYSHLIDRNSATCFWASDSDRVIDTARYFAAGFFGLYWDTDGSAEFEIIPETADRGADTLTPGDTCKNFKEYTSTEQRYIKKLAEVQDMYLPPISKRLEKENPEIPFTVSEVYSMQEMCGFETTVRGSSPWCDVFTYEDWRHFEYARDVSLYYRLGPGNPYGGVMGWLWLNATTSLLLEGPDSGKTFFSFVHDGDMAPMMTALNLLQDEANDPELPTTHIASNRKWLTSQLMPMGGRIILERLTCTPTPSTSSGEDPTQQFIRINVNDGIMPLGNCTSGPGHSCPLSEFAEFVHSRGIELGDFEDVCGIEKNGDGPGGLSFLHQKQV